MAFLRIDELKIEWISSKREGRWRRTGYLPILDAEKPVFSWRLSSSEKNTFQTKYRIRVCNADRPEAEVWSGGEQETGIQSAEYAGPAFDSFSEYVCILEVRDNHGMTAEKTMTFETGRMSGDPWRSSFLVPRQKCPAGDVSWKGELEKDPDNSGDLTPALRIRRDFVTEKKVRKGRVYATAHGVYELYLDGRRISDVELAPGFTSYHSFLEYQAYDITPFLAPGEHTLGVLLGDGWFLGHIGVTGMNCQYGEKKALFCEIHLEYEDGSEKVLGGSGGFFSQESALDYSDLFVGECIHAEKASQRWNLPGEWPGVWEPVMEEFSAGDALKAAYGEPVRCVRRLPAKSAFHSSKGELILDFGQVLAGKAEIILRDTKPGQKVVFRHTEVLDAEGNYYHNIAGNFKDQRDVYICRGAEEERYCPHFTFHGFRYIRVEGYENENLREDAAAWAMYCDMEDTGSFSCSDARLNQLFRNIVWSQYGNMLSVPTDCPQRERAGWTGDAQIFCETAALNMDVSAFFRRWMFNLRLDQKEDGQIPVVSPYHKSYHPEVIGIDGNESAAGWGDVIAFLPWRMYLAYGDVRWLRENYTAMKRWAGYVRREAENGIPEANRHLSGERLEDQKYLWNTGFNFGDWLVPSLSSPDENGQADVVACMERTKDEISTCYYAELIRILAGIAEILQEPEDALYYSRLAERIREAFRREYVRDDGRLISDMQGTYVIAVAFDMLTESQSEAAAGRLRELILENQGCLDTGFLSVDRILDVLCGTGSRDLAYEILFQRRAPSWLYEVEQGATTVWEAWKAIMPDGTPSACSFNHYAFGCVGRFLYQRIGGLCVEKPGYRKFRVEPDFHCGLQNAEIEYRCVFGQIRIRWNVSDGAYRLTVEIPAGAEARICLPDQTLLAGSGTWSYSGTI